MRKGFSKRRGTLSPTTGPMNLPTVFEGKRGWRTSLITRIEIYKVSSKPRPSFFSTIGRVVGYLWSWVRRLLTPTASSWSWDKEIRRIEGAPFSTSTRESTCSSTSKKP